MKEIEFNLPKAHNFGSNKKTYTSADLDDSIKKEFKLLCSDFGIKQAVKWYKMIGYSDEKLKEFLL